MRGFFHSFAIRDYRWLWLMTTLTNAGSWTFTLVATWQSYELTHSSSWTGAIMFATLIPNLLGAPIAGTLADLMDRRRILLFASLAQIIVTTLLAILSYSHSVTPGWLLGLSLLFGFFSSALSVLLSSLVPVIVPSEKLFNALSLQAVAQRGTEFVGPAIASPMLLIYGSDLVYLFAALLYLLASTFVFMLTKVHIQHDESSHGGTRHAFSPLIDGFAYTKRTTTIGLLISLVGLHCALTMAYMGMLPQFVNTIHGTSAFYGVMVSTIGLGSIIGTLILAGIKSVRSRGSLYLVTAIVSGASLSMLAFCSNHAIAVLAIALVGASQAMFMTLSLGYIQHMAAPRMRGRVTGLYMVLAGGLMSLANLGYGALSGVIAPRLIMTTSGLVFVVIVAVYAALSRQFRSVSMSGLFVAQHDMPVPSSLSV